MIDTLITGMLKIKYPIIMAPMFLISNEEMLVAAHESGITGCVPSLNYRTPEELKAALAAINKRTNGNFGVNLIVNKSNINLKTHFPIVMESGVKFIITSLGSPKEVIEAARKNNIKVFCDVVEEGYAKKVEDMGADGVIAVNSGAGGHAGEIPASILIPMLKKACKIPVIAAGGVGTGAGLLSMLSLGADAISMGSPFIATKEAPVGQDYKNACLQYGAKDIVKTTKLSGTPCTVIKTPYVEEIGTEQNFVENMLNKNKQMKKYAKMFTAYKGMKLLEKAAFSASYKSVWCAGPSIEFTHEMSTIPAIVTKVMNEYDESHKLLAGLINK
ncbi:MAG: NAD(P)H-dependent flavin oxidoreductase [Bacteriovoracaceae bacterium]